MLIANLSVDIGVAFEVLAREGQGRLGVEVLADVGDPLWVLSDHRGQRREILGNRIAGDRDPSGLIPLVDHVEAGNGRPGRGDALLAVDQDLLVSGRPGRA